MKRPARHIKRKTLSVKRQEKNLLRQWFKFFVVVPVLLLCVLEFGLWNLPKVHAASGINKQINFQGKLVDNNGLNVANSTYTVVFSLYNLSSGGTATWTETDSVTTSNGVFQVALGVNTPFPGNVDFNSDTWYLGIKVGSDAEMTPRIRFSAVPYAFNAASLDGIVATNSASQFTITGGTNALIDLTVNGSLTLGSTIKPTATGGITLDTNGANTLALGTSANSITFGATNNPNYSFNGSGTVTFQGTSFTLGNGSDATIQTTSTGGLTLNSASGRVSIASGDFLNIGLSGVTGAQAGDIWYDTSAQKFKINENGTTKIVCNTTDLGCGSGGAITLQSAYNSGQTIDLSQAGSGLVFGTGLGTQNVTIAPNAGGRAALIINDQGNGDIFTASASGTTKLVLSNAGNLGVGSSSPQQALTLGPTANLVGEMAVPTSATATLQSSGSLANATYFYVITASDGIGETIRSTETSGCTSTNGGGGQHTCLVAWSPVVGAVSYKVYRTTTSGTYGSTSFLTSVTTTSYTDTGAVSLTAGTPPGSTTAYVTKLTYSGNSWIIGDNFGLGTTSPLATLHVKGGKSGGNAAEIIDQVGASTNDILTGSASGQTKFRVANTGQFDVVGGLGSDIDTIGTATLTIGGSTQNGLTVGRSGVTTTINGSNFSVNSSGAITAANSSNTINGLVINSGALSSVSSVDTVAFSATSIGFAGTGSVTSGAATTLSIDSGTTGALNIGTGSNGKTITIGNTTANTALVFNTGGTGNITLGSNNGTGNVVVQPNAGGQAAFIVNKQFTSGDVFTASDSGVAVFTVGQAVGTAANGFTFTPSTTTNAVAEAATGSDTNIGLTIDGKGTGTVTINGTGTGTTIIGHGLTLTSGTTLTLTGDTITGAPTWGSNQTITLATAAQPNVTSLGTLTALNVSGLTTLTSNNAQALTVGPNGSTNPVFTVDGSGSSSVTGLKVLGAATGGTTALSVTDSGSNANLSLDAKGSGTITIGGTSTGNVVIGNGTGATVLQIGTSLGNGLTLSALAGPAYTGNARPTKQIVLSAEYPGAVLTASNSAAIAGNMTSDASPSAVTTTTNNYENYYQWAATSLGTDQQYTIAVRVTLPKDFSDWSSGNAITVDFNTPFTSSALNSLDVFIYKGGDTTGKPVAFSKANVSGTSKNWATVSFTKTQLTTVTPTLTAAGQEAVFYLTLHSTNTVNYVQVGDITLNYLAAF